jgi:hypothetical protein
MTEYERIVDLFQATSQQDETRIAQILKDTSFLVVKRDNKRRLFEIQKLLHHILGIVIKEDMGKAFEALIEKCNDVYMMTEELIQMPLRQCILYDRSTMFVALVGQFDSLGSKMLIYLLRNCLELVPSNSQQLSPERIEILMRLSREPFWSKECNMYVTCCKRIDQEVKDMVIHEPMDW